MGSDQRHQGQVRARGVTRHNEWALAQSAGAFSLSWRGRQPREKAPGHTGRGGIAPQPPPPPPWPECRPAGRWSSWRAQLRSRGTRAPVPWQRTASRGLPSRRRHARKGPSLSVQEECTRAWRIGGGCGRERGWGRARRRTRQLARTLAGTGSRARFCQVEPVLRSWQFAGSWAKRRVRGRHSAGPTSPAFERTPSPPQLPPARAGPEKGSITVQSAALGVSSARTML